MKRLILALMTCGALILSGAAWLNAQQRRRTIATDDFVELQRLLWTNHIGYDFADRDNGDLWVSTFTRDAVLESGSTPPLSGEAAIRDFAVQPLKTNPNRKFRHWTSTFHATPHPEGATLVAFFMAVMNNGPGGAMQMSTTGYYESVAVKTRNGWKLKHHVVHQEGNIVAAR